MLLGYAKSFSHYPSCWLKDKLTILKKPQKIISAIGNKGISIVVKDVPRFRAARRPFTKAPLRCNAVHRCASIPYLLLLLFFLFLFFSFFSSPASGCKGQREALISFFIFWDQNDIVLDLFEKCQNNVDLTLLILKKKGPKWRCFGVCSFKIKSKPKQRPFCPVFPSSPIFWLFSTRQLSQILP